MSNEKTKGRIFVILQFTFASIFVLAAVIESRIAQRAQIEVINIISIIFLFLGAATVLLALIAFRQRITPNPVPLESAKLRTNGIYRFIRHPMYTSVIFVFIGFSLYMTAYFTFLTNIGVIIFLITKIKFEEHQLLEKFPEYRSYQLKTKKLIPFIY